MIYFDNAATTFPKPPQVTAALKRAVAEYGGNPGRAGHSFSLKTAEAVYSAREKCAEFFGAESQNTVFTLNCTHALNMAIKGIAAAADRPHFIISDIEHNAVARPLYSLRESATYSVAITYPGNCGKTLQSFESLINARTKAVICAAASNVTGAILPYRQIGELCKKRGVCFILDAAQGGGVLPITLADGVNFICCSGHKGLYAPMGTGLLVTDGKYKLSTIIEGGTGSNSLSLEQPETLPDRLESGTINTPGVIALGAAVDFVVKTGIARIREHENRLCEMFTQGASQNKRIRLYSPKQGESAPIVAFNVEGLDSSKVSAMLSDSGFCLRGGLHCAFLAHKKLGTLDSGAVRFAPSVFNTKREVAALLKTLAKF